MYTNLKIWSYPKQKQKLKSEWKHGRPCRRRPCLIIRTSDNFLQKERILDLKWVMTWWILASTDQWPTTDIWLQDSPFETVSGCDNKQVGHNGAPAVKLLSELNANSPGIGACTGLLAIHDPRVSLGRPAHWNKSFQKWTKMSSPQKFWLRFNQIQWKSSSLYNGLF